MNRITCLACGLLLVASLPGDALATDLQPWLTALRGVGPMGQGQTEAVEALAQLRRADAAVLPQIVKAFDGASPLAANWLTGAFESIADRQLRSGRPIPADELEALVRETRHDPRGRRLAYEWLLRVDPGLEDRLIPGMLNDPGTEFRRDAVARILAEVSAVDAKQDRERAVALYRQALRGATDPDQVQAIVKPLKELGVKVDLPRHFGFVADWDLIGPFDNTGPGGCDASFSPESDLDRQRAHQGKLATVRWTPYTTPHDYGVVDLAKVLAPHKAAAVYAAADFHTSEEQTVEIRIGTPNSWKLWVNGELLFGREEYHRSMQLDQYRVPCRIQAGRNTILLKVCQNDQPDDWAQRWQFQLRVCDLSGTGLPARPADPKSTAGARTSEEQPR